MTDTLEINDLLEEPSQHNRVSSKQAKRERKKERRKARQESYQKAEEKVFDMKSISPMTKNQEQLFRHHGNDYNLFLHGTAGTGKTFLSIYLALQDILDGKYEKLLIVRSLVPSRDIGFLPGNVKEKAMVYEGVYYGIFNELFERGDAYEIAKRKGIVEFVPSSFIRGATFRNCVILIDELQNLTFSELNTVITRVGENCKIYLSGDIRQTDLNKKYDRSGLSDFAKIIKSMKAFKSIEFTHDDIVRSEFLKEYIMSKDKLIDSGAIKLDPCFE